MNGGKNCFSYVMYGIKHLLIKYVCFKFFIQIRYQKEIDRLIKENKDLRKSLMLKEPKNGRKRTMRVCRAFHSMIFQFHCNHFFILVTSFFSWKMLWYMYTCVCILCKLNKRYIWMCQIHKFSCPPIPSFEPCLKMN